VVVTPNHRTESIVVTPPHRGGHYSRLDADIWTDRSTYRIGDTIDVNFRVNRDAFVYIFNTDARGVTTQIFPNFYDQDNRARANRTYTLPDRNYDLRVVGPSGTESLEIYAVTDRDSFRRDFHRFSAREPFRALTPSGERTLNQLRVEPTPDPRRGNRMIVVDPRPDCDWDSETITFNVRAPHHRPWAISTGELIIDCNVGPVTVYIDGVYRGNGPGAYGGLTPGYHDIELVSPGHRTYRARVNIRPGQETRLAVNLRRDWDDDWRSHRGSSGGFYGHVNRDRRGHVDINAGILISRLLRCID